VSMTDGAGSREVFSGEHPSESLAASLSAMPSTDSISEEVTEQTAPHTARWKKRVALVTLIIAIVAAAVVVPPLINVRRYQSQITALVSRSLGRPVRLSGVELRLLPRPGFVLHDLSVSEDPEFGAEPILSAQTVVASIAISSLWRGNLEVNRISVDEASLNLVRSAEGAWNLQSLMIGRLKNGIQTGTQASSLGSSNAARRPAPLPYLEATNSRVNLKNGLEKSPFSLVSTELSLWQETPGNWRLRLRGQPVRTDMEISLADTGEVRVEATVTASNTSRELRDMSFRVQAEWREAQLGQLSRLLLGSDAGWRGDLTADMDVQGTLDAAQTRARLRATGVRRAEFAPAAPLDFDANCNFRYEHTQKAFRNVGCDTAIGAGLLHLKADLPGDSGTPEATLDIKQLPVQAGLDMLRTLRGGFAPGVVAQGEASGSLSLIPVQAKPAGVRGTNLHGNASSPRTAKSQTASSGTGSLNLQGAVTVTGGQLRGGSLKQPLTLPRMTWTPMRVSDTAGGGSVETGLVSRFTIALGSVPAASTAASGATSAGQSVPPTNPETRSAAKPRTSSTSQKKQAVQGSQTAQGTQDISVRLTLTAQGYDASVAGSASPSSLRDLAYAFGAPHLDAADGFSGGVADLDVTAAGPWITSPDTLLLQTLPASGQAADSVPPSSQPRSDRLSGSVQLYHATWSASYLARPVELPQATVALSGTAVAMTSDFVFGGVNGSMTVNADVDCKSPDCQPQIRLRLGNVDAKDIEGALLGEPEKKGLLSPLIDRVRSPQRPKWPVVSLTAEAESLTLGPATLRQPVIQMKTEGAPIVLESWEAGLLGGTAKGTGRCSWSADGPKYAIDAKFAKLSAASLGALLSGTSANADADSDSDDKPEPATTWSGGPVNGSGSVQISGLTAAQLVASATGTVHFQWMHGGLPYQSQTGARAQEVAVRFDDWSGEATLAGGKAQLGENILRQGRRTASVAGTFPFNGVPKLTVKTPDTRIAVTPGPKKAPSGPAVQ